jgi:hypothetical protein
MVRSDDDAYRSGLVHTQDNMDASPTDLPQKQVAGKRLVVGLGDENLTVVDHGVDIVDRDPPREHLPDRVTAEANRSEVLGQSASAPGRALRQFQPDEAVLGSTLPRTGRRLAN